jgi:hypothetical protein
MPCTKGMAVRREDAPGCHRACRHRTFVTEYQAARENDVQAAEAASNGWEAEFREYVRDHPLMTFQRWLVQMKGWSAA